VEAERAEPFTVEHRRRVEVIEQRRVELRRGGNASAAHPTPPERRGTAQKTVQEGVDADSERRDDADAGDRRDRHTRPKTTHSMLPPKPNALLSATRTRLSRGRFATTSMSHAGSGVS